MMDLYGHGLGYAGRPVLGLEEGQVDVTCGPGTTKVYLQEFPWEKCVPDSELETTSQETRRLPMPEPIPGEPEPPALPAQEVQPYAPPGKARFLEVDPSTGAVLDPDTGLPLQAETVLMLKPVETAATAIGVLAVVGLTILGLGIFSSGK
jgi:hypothetical protein